MSINQPQTGVDDSPDIPAELFDAERSRIAAALSSAVNGSPAAAQEFAKVFRNVLHNPERDMCCINFCPQSLSLPLPTHGYSLRTLAHSRQLPDRLSHLVDYRLQFYHHACCFISHTDARELFVYSVFRPNRPVTGTIWRIVMGAPATAAGRRRRLPVSATRCA